MKKLIFVIFTSFGLPSIGPHHHAKSEKPKTPSIWVVPPEVDRECKFSKRPKKTQEFNRTEGADLWATWKVLTGPRTGQYARLFGVSSWAFTTNTINIPRSNEESSYWREKITPLQKTKIAPMEVWMNVPGTEYNNLEEGVPTRYGVIQKWKMKPGMYQEENSIDVRSSCCKR